MISDRDKSEVGIPEVQKLLDLVIGVAQSVACELEKAHKTGLKKWEDRFNY